MATLLQPTLTESRGNPRLCINGVRLSREGLVPGTALVVTEVAGRLILTPTDKDATGDNIVRVTGRKRRGKTLAWLEFQRPELGRLFELNQPLSVMLDNGTVTISRHHQHGKIAVRNAALLDSLTRGEPLKVASLYHGGGVLDCALHAGMERHGVASYCRIASEIDARYIDSSLSNNPHLFRQDSLILNTPIEQYNFLENQLPVHILCGGVPCTGASNAGKSANHIQYAEQHSSAGSQFFAFLRMIEATNPAICILENVPQYRNTASYAVILSVLKTFGYQVQDTNLVGCDYGALEKRTRMCMVAVSEGLAEFDMDDIVRLIDKPATLGEVLDPDEVVEPLWRDFAYLRQKEASDKAAGKGFMRQLMERDAVSVPTITRDYMKIRSTDPQLQHPTEPLLSRLFTPEEHARIKGIPERIIKDNAPSVAHQILGQSVIYPAFLSVGDALGRWMRRQVPRPAAKPRQRGKRARSLA